MKTLQNNFTTPEESKRLLELGVPANSADCYYDKCAEVYDRYNICEDGYFGEHYQSFKQLIPCWSVGRLIEIIGKTRVDMYATTFVTTSASNMLLQVIGRLEALVLNNNIDFSKLEN